MPGTGDTVGLPAWRCALLTTTIPLAPPSDEPMASVITTSGKRSRNWSLSEGEKMAAVEDSDRIDDRSRLRLGSSSRASTSGRAMASPVIMIELAFSASTRRHTSCGSNDP